MFYFKLIIAIAAIVAGVDRLLGGKLGIGKEFERGFTLWGAMALSMIGMIVLAPWLAKIMSPLFEFIAEKTPFDPSIVPASLFANDMGGATLSMEVASDELMGRFNAFVVSSMMGCTISFTLPFSLGLVKKERLPQLCLGLLSGTVTIPIGCFVSGLMLGVPVGALCLDLLPLIVIAAVIAFGLIKAPALCVKIFRIFGFIVKALILVGLAIGMLEFLTKDEATPIRILDDPNGYADGAMVCVNAATVLAGMFPIFAVLSRVLRRPLAVLGNKLGINDASALGLLGNLATNATTFGMFDKMDDNGAIINSAFSVSAAFVFGGHMAYTMAYCEEMLPYVIVGKLISGVCALAVAAFVAKKHAASTEKI